jgi:nicotinate-nucleotide--dimethylbenzimidazole phosphoribosyltransferase
MGIGNTSSATLLMHTLTGLPLAQCVGRGTGLDNKQLAHKVTVLQQALKQNIGWAEVRSPSIANDGLPASAHPIALNALTTFGGFEIAMMVGAYLQAAEHGMVIMVDGFIASSALLVACTLHPNVLDYCVFSHISDEQGHQALLKHFNATALLNLNLRLGEGSGIALAYPLLQSAVLFLNEMASFAEAGVDSK